MMTLVEVNNGDCPAYDGARREGLEESGSKESVKNYF